MLQRLQIYLQCDARQHAALLGAVVLFCGLIYFGYRQQNHIKLDAREATAWPSIEAQVVSSQIKEINTSDEVSFSTRLHVRARFSYLMKGQVKHADYIGHWTRNDHRDWSELLRPGSQITIRVSPDEPVKVSLVDYNGIQ